MCRLWLDRFFDAYADLGVTFWGLTPQNEPEDGNIPFFPFNCMGWNPETMTTFIADHLGPTLDTNGYDFLKMIIIDDQRWDMPHWARIVSQSASEMSRWNGFHITFTVFI